MRKVTHARKRNPWADRDELLHRYRVHDVITSANFYDCRLWGLSVVGVKFWVSPLTRVVALTTLSHYRASDFSLLSERNYVINTKNLRSFITHSQGSARVL